MISKYKNHDKYHQTTESESADAENTLVVIQEERGWEEGAGNVWK